MAKKINLSDEQLASVAHLSARLAGQALGVSTSYIHARRKPVERPMPIPTDIDAFLKDVEQAFLTDFRYAEMVAKAHWEQVRIEAEQAAE